MYPATVVWVGATSARVEFNDGAMKTLPYEELASPSENSTGAASGPTGRQALEDPPPPLDERSGRCSMHVVPHRSRVGLSLKVG